MSFSDFLRNKLDDRMRTNSIRALRLNPAAIDFTSNDYLGIVRNGLLEPQLKGTSFPHGSTGSRLLSGNYSLIEETEKLIANFHEAESGLIFNSGYDANLGLLGCIANKSDTILFDQLSHASIRDGIRLSFAQSHGFQHNDLSDLESKLMQASGNVFVITESLFSMDGDTAPLKEISALCYRYKAALIVDEAHATGTIGQNGEGLVQQLNLQSRCFARIHTFGKALGCHGAIVLGSLVLRDYLINFCRPFVYTTALPPIAVAAIRAAYNLFPELSQERKQLSALVEHWCASSWGSKTSRNTSAIQYIMIPGNDKAKYVATALQNLGIDARAILYPSVPKGAERLRIVLHAFNTLEEIDYLNRTPDLFASNQHESA